MILILLNGGFMRKMFVLAMLVMGMGTYAFAGGYLNLGDDYAVLTNNKLFNSGVSTVSYFNGSVGAALDCGLIAGLRYDHLGIEDKSFGTENVRLVAAIPALELGYYSKLMDEKLLWWTTARIGYAVSARYRRGITDYKATAFVPAVSTALYYNFVGKFYAGLEVGYRYFNVKYAGLDSGSNELNLSGIFIGVSFLHFMGK